MPNYFTHLESPSIIKKILLFFFASLWACTIADASVLVLFPDGTYVTKKNLTVANSAVDVAGKTVIVTDSQTFSGPWRSDAKLKVEYGGKITIPTGQTLAINGPFEAGLYQVFNCLGTGKVVFGYGTITNAYPEWWAANTNPGTTDMTAAIQAAIDAMEGTYEPYVPITGGGKVVLSRSRYAVSAINVKTRVTLQLSDGTQLLTSGTITMNSSSQLIGAGRQSSQIIYSGTGHAISGDSSASPGSMVDVRLENFWLNCSVASSTNSAIYFSNMNHPTIIGVKSTASPTGAPFIEIVRSALPVIRGLSLQGAAMGASPFIKIYQDSDAVDISNCRLIGANLAGREGILIDNPGSSNSAITSIHNNSFEYFDVAIRVANTASSTVSSVSIKNNYFENTKSHEIVVGNNSTGAIGINITIEDNYFYSQATAADAVYARLANNLTIRNNRSLNHRTAMIRILSGVKNFRISANYTTDPIQQHIEAGATGVYDDQYGNITYEGKQ